jgi:hypothetical protein
LLNETFEAFARLFAFNWEKQARLYKHWFEDGGYGGRPVSPREFKTRMEDMGARYERTMHERVYRGVRLDVTAEPVNES